MVGYLAGPVVGAQIYNAGHTYSIPLVIGAMAYGVGSLMLATVTFI